VSGWDDWLLEVRADTEERGLFRRLRPLAARDGLRATLDGRPVVLFASNDYLGLASHPEVRAAAADAAREVGMGPRGAALVCGYTTLHEELARELARLKGTEAALLFPTGYATNLSVLSALAGPGTEIYSDERNHASIIDGCRLAKAKGATVRVYRHADPAHLSSLLEESAAPRRLIVTDAVFSMDGDRAPLIDLVEVAERHGALVALDEAHALLVLGEEGGGLAEETGLADRVDLHVGTLGKALGSQGGFLAGSSRLVEHVVNHARPFIYSTALPVPAVAAARAAIDVFRSEPARRERLDAHRAALGAALEPSGSAIFKVVLGTEDAALEASRRLLEQGYFVPGIRPPTVPPGTSRLRVTVSAGHTDEEVEGLLNAL
jgi:8-amino-7-oxononanoate synthase